MAHHAEWYALEGFDQWRLGGVGLPIGAVVDQHLADFAAPRDDPALEVVLGVSSARLAEGSRQVIVARTDDTLPRLAKM